MIVERIRKIIDYKKISTRQFCIEVGVANGFLDKVKDVGSEKLLKILNTYPELSPEWLLTGKGDMLKKNEKGGISQTISGDNNTMSGNDTYMGSSDKETISQLKERLAEAERKLEEKDQQISKLINVIEKLNSI